LNGSGSAISVRGLRKIYGDFEAVRGIDFEVYAGEVFGLLGPNGDVVVLGYDPGVQVRQLKDRIGVCLQATNLPEKIKVHEALTLFASFYSRNVDNSKLLERLQLSDKRNEYYSRLSGGQKQRVALALAMVNDPQLLFLDEPTSGLDPQVRLEIHGLIEELRGAKRTILLTTHYIEEAERLCDRVAIIDEGRIVALGTPHELQARVLGQSSIEISCDHPLPADGLPIFVKVSKYALSDDRRNLSMHSAQPAKAIVELVKWIDQLGIELSDIHLKRPTLEDVFLELTGKRLRE